MMDGLSIAVERALASGTSMQDVFAGSFFVGISGLVFYNVIGKFGLWSKICYQTVVSKK